MPFRALLELVLPSHCPGCAEPGRPVCPRCAAALTGPPHAVLPTPPPPGFPFCRAVATYEGPVRSVLIAYKERGRRDLLRPLAVALAEAVAPDSTTAAPWRTGTLILVPVPSRTAAVRVRGTDTTGNLAAEAGRVLRRAGLPTRVMPVLRLRRATGDSAGLGAAARRANLCGAMVADRGALSTAAAADRVVVVDDLVTTGATLAEAARALTLAGRAPVAAAVVAATVRQLRVSMMRAAR